VWAPPGAGSSVVSPAGGFGRHCRGCWQGEQRAGLREVVGPTAVGERAVMADTMKAWRQPARPTERALFTQFFLGARPRQHHCQTSALGVPGCAWPRRQSASDRSWCSQGPCGRRKTAARNPADPLIGPISSIFDYVTFFMMLTMFQTWDKPALFQTGWFVESLLTQTLIIHIIRTAKVPFLESRASAAVIATSPHHCCGWYHPAVHLARRHLGLCPAADGLLGAPLLDPARLCHPDTSHEDVVRSQIRVGLSDRLRPTKTADANSGAMSCACAMRSP
jgi:hypothetical protein